jgi:two-component system OmpR family sensor kinase
MIGPRPTLTQILTRRLIWLAAAAVIVNVLAVGIYYGSDRRALESEVIDLQMESLEGSLEGSPPRVSARGRSLFVAHPEAYGFALLDREGQIVDIENPLLVPLQVTRTDVFVKNWVTSLDTEKGRVLAAAHRVESRPDQLRIVFVMADDPAGLRVRALINEFVSHIWLPILPIVLILIGANALMIRRGLQPLASAAEWAQSIRPGRPSPALPDDPLPAEVQALVGATQRSLERVNAALAAEQRHAAEAAHALRTPGAVLMARLDALPPGEIKDRLRDDLNALSRTIRQVLACARADALDWDGEVPIDLVPIAERVVAATAPLAYERGLELSLKTSPASVQALADEDAVEVALSNLVENAILHGGRGPIEITVGPGPEIRVRDRGPGLSPGGKRRIFEPFWRAENAPPGGTGLGLAIVERLQQAQNGSIDVKAPADGGTAFVLSYGAAPDA